MIAPCEGMKFRDKDGDLCVIVEKTQRGWFKVKVIGERSTQFWDSYERAESCVEREMTEMDPLEFAALNAEVLNGLCVRS